MLLRERQPTKAQGRGERRSDSARRPPFPCPGASAPPLPSASGLLRAPGQSQRRAHVNHSPLANERPPFPRGDVRDASSASALSLLAVKTAPPPRGRGGSVLSCSGHVTRSSPGGEVAGADVHHIVPFVLCSVVAW